MKKTQRALRVWTVGLILAILAGSARAGTHPDWWIPYGPNQTERENVFAFTEKPTIRLVGPDRYEISFAVKGNCDATVAIVDPDPAKERVKGRGTVVRHLASGVLGANAPEPFQKNSLKQTIYWDGKDDLDWYHKEPETLTLRVMLGLKPEFDKRLGPTNPKALSGYIWGLAADPSGVYVFLKSGGHVSWRKFDHDANYLKDMYPPSGQLPPEKLGGMGYIEYEPGKRAIQAPDLPSGMWHYGDWTPVGIKGVRRCRPIVANGRIYMLSSGHGQSPRGSSVTENFLHWFHTDGSTDYAGVTGRVFVRADGGTSISPALAASPDGKRVYVTGLHGAGAFGASPPSPVLMAGAVDGDKPAEILVGAFGREGGDNRSFNAPLDVATDPQGRIYVTDANNNRIQIFSPDGEYLKTLQASRPNLIQIHQKTGQVYLTHQARVKGRATARITRFSPFPKLEEEQAWDGFSANLMALDSWAPRPRLWMSGRTAGGGTRRFADSDGLSADVSVTEGAMLHVYEDTGEELKLLSDFEKEARDEGNYIHFGGGIKYPVRCDPVREQAYYLNRWVFDLPTGKLLGETGLDSKSRDMRSGLAFDKRGYLHVHRQDRDQKYILRFSPDRLVERRRGRHLRNEYPEVPYDYGEEAAGYVGALIPPASDDKYFSWGFGSNMRGELAVLIMLEHAMRTDAEKAASRADFVRRLQEQQLKADRDGVGEIFFIRPRPEIDLNGGVIWTYESSGEVKNKEAVIVGGYRTHGTEIDEDGFLYFTNGRMRYAGGKTFLRGRGGNFGGEPYLRWNRSPFTGTQIKAAPDRARFIKRNPAIPGDGPPDRPPDLNQSRDGNPEEDTWAEGVEWMYAGVSPIVHYHCGCPDLRAALDWYKRSFVPEMYRHSVGIVDTAGNLIVHVGRYGNLDEGGKPSPGDDGVRMTRGAYVSVTDNYLVVADWGRRLTVATLNYHAEETIGIDTERR